MEYKLTTDILNNMIKVLDDNNVPKEVRVVWYTSKVIKHGLVAGHLEDRKGFVSWGGIDVYDSTKGRKAVTADYV